MKVPLPEPLGRAADIRIDHAASRICPSKGILQPLGTLMNYRERPDAILVDDW
jgi:hypothetical protein